jgi:hypothetical protein
MHFGRFCPWNGSECALFYSHSWDMRVDLGTCQTGPDSQGAELTSNRLDPLPALLPTFSP